ncbi:hypothetical protein GCM10029964_092530 [Kibdelosporangium lantanae]
MIRRLAATAAALVLVAAPTAAAQVAVAPAAGTTVEYNVLAADGQPIKSVAAAVAAAGGTVTAQDPAVGLLTATAPAAGFAERVTTSGALVAPAWPMGTAPRVAAGMPRRWQDLKWQDRESIQQEAAGTKDLAGPRRPRTTTPGLDPLDGTGWWLTATHADRARQVAGDRRVTVGVIDSGVDASNPDIAPAFNHRLSKTFAKDIPTDPNGEQFDGP